MSGEDWIAGINRLTLPPDLPVTLQGGEPTVYKDFYQIASHRPFWGRMDLLTNLMIDEDVFMKNVPPEAFKREAPYASIRVSWHIGQNDGPALLRRVQKLLKHGYQVGIWAVDHPEHHEDVLKAQLEAWSMGIDFRLKEFLGPHGGKEYGTFRYPGAVNDAQLRYCECRTTELLIGPEGSVFRCHSDLYADRLPIGHILDDRLPLVGRWIPCAVYGRCNSCDIKLKTNRHQVNGHSSVAIKHLSQPYAPNAQVDKVENTYGKQDSNVSL